MRIMRVNEKMKWGRGAIIALIMAGLSIPFSFQLTEVSAQIPDTPNPDIWITDGPVFAIASADGILYLGGSFSYVGPNTGSGVSITTATGAVMAPYLRINGTVSAAVSDGSGGWYIGGGFTLVGNVERNHIAHILPDGTLDTSWNPNADGSIYALEVSGGVVYAGGYFTTIGGQARGNVAAIDAVTGSAILWDLRAAGTVYSLTASEGVVYAGGDFRLFGGYLRNRIAAIDTSTGLATSWNPGANETVYSLAVSGGIVYAGGNFTEIGGQVRNHIAAIDAITGAVVSWSPEANGIVRVLAVSEGNVVYAGGDFSTIGGQARDGIGAIDAITGVATSWNPGPTRLSRTVRAVGVSGGVVFLGGDFTSIGGQARNNIVAFDAATGATTAWNPGANEDVRSLAVSGGVVYAGGDFTSIGGEPRNHIAAIDPVTGAATSWNPSANVNVHAMAVSGGIVYAGGGFTIIGGQARSHIAAIDAVTGVATSWNPGASGSNFSSVVSTLAVSEGVVYAGGYFTTIGGQARNYIAAIDAATGTATPWNPDANSTVLTLLASGGVVYAGGSFTKIGGQTRNHVAAINASTGTATSWNPDVHGYQRHRRVLALAVNGGVVYTGGEFTGIGGETRYNIAAIDVVTGLATSWEPKGIGTVYVLAARAEAVYVGGSRFTQFGTVYTDIDPPSKDFGKVVLDSTVSEVFTISNYSAGDLVIHSMELTGNDADMFSLEANGPNPCTNLTPTIAPGGSCTFVVRFTPSSEETKTAALRITSNDPASPVDVLLTGKGSLQLGIDPGYRDFGVVIVDTTSSQTFFVSNNGTTDLVVASMELIEDDVGNFRAVTGGPNPCPSLTPTLTPGGSCTFVARFTPITEGVKTATLRITSTDPWSPMEVPLTGKGTFDHAVARISPTYLDFGFVNVSHRAEHAFTISNTGTANLVISSMMVISGDSAAFGVTQGGTYSCMFFTPTIPPGTSCTIGAWFYPSSDGPKTTTLRITSNDPAGPIEVRLDGTGMEQSVFNDVPRNHWAAHYINMLFYSGVTGGCGGGNYCPDEHVTRGQMAVFIETSLGSTPTECTGLFGDVPVGHPFCGFIERLAVNGITGGCKASDFCPDAPVTRGQMAAFIEAALGNPVNPCTGQFADVSLDNPFCGFIERLAVDGITGGCGGSNFCPNDPVTRAQMAVFLVAAPLPLNP